MRRTTSSIQSVAGQPVASPDAMPAHQGLTSPSGLSATIWSESSMSSSHVVGTS
ncbi:Uncharacterised protein [Mycobacteroides abscessus]|nr:Uncharacterised protein [Mycobacteroides abscessus]